MTTTILDPTAVRNWHDARSALAFDDRETNRMWEQQAREALGQCACGKAAVHLLADEDGPEWPCRVPEVSTAKLTTYDHRQGGTGVLIESAPDDGSEWGALRVWLPGSAGYPAEVSAQESWRCDRAGLVKMREALDLAIRTMDAQ